MPVSASPVGPIWVRGPQTSRRSTMPTLTLSLPRPSSRELVDSSAASLVLAAADDLRLRRQRLKDRRNSLNESLAQWKKKRFLSASVYDKRLAPAPTPGAAVHKSPAPPSPRLSAKRHSVDALGSDARGPSWANTSARSHSDWDVASDTDSRSPGDPLARLAVRRGSHVFLSDGELPSPLVGSFQKDDDSDDTVFVSDSTSRPAGDHKRECQDTLWGSLGLGACTSSAQQTGKARYRGKWRDEDELLDLLCQCDDFSERCHIRSCLKSIKESLQVRQTGNEKHSLSTSLSSVTPVLDDQTSFHVRVASATPASVPLRSHPASCQEESGPLKDTGCVCDQGDLVPTSASRDEIGWTVPDPCGTNVPAGDGRESDMVVDTGGKEAVCARVLDSQDYENIHDIDELRKLLTSTADRDLKRKIRCAMRTQRRKQEMDKIKSNIAPLSPAVALSDPGTLQGSSDSLAQGQANTSLRLSALDVDRTVGPSKTDVNKSNSFCETSVTVRQAQSVSRLSTTRAHSLRGSQRQQIPEAARGSAHPAQARAGSRRSEEVKDARTPAQLGEKPDADHPAHSAWVSSRQSRRVTALVRAPDAQSRGSLRHAQAVAETTTTTLTTGGGGASSCKSWADCLRGPNTGVLAVSRPRDTVQAASATKSVSGRTAAGEDAQRVQTPAATEPVTVLKTDPLDIYASKAGATDISFRIHPDDLSAANVGKRTAGRDVSSKVLGSGDSSTCRKLEGPASQWDKESWSTLTFLKANNALNTSSFDSKLSERGLRSDSLQTVSLPQNKQLQVVSESHASEETLLEQKNSVHKEENSQIIIPGLEGILSAACKQADIVDIVSVTTHNEVTPTASSEKQTGMLGNVVPVGLLDIVRGNASPRQSEKEAEDVSRESSSGTSWACTVSACTVSAPGGPKQDDLDWDLVNKVKARLKSRSESRSSEEKLPEAVKASQRVALTPTSGTPGADAQSGGGVGVKLSSVTSQRRGADASKQSEGPSAISSGVTDRSNVNERTAQAAQSEPTRTPADAAAPLTDFQRLDKGLRPSPSKRLVTSLAGKFAPHDSCDRQSSSSSVVQPSPGHSPAAGSVLPHESELLSGDEARRVDLQRAGSFRGDRARDPGIHRSVTPRRAGSFGALDCLARRPVDRNVLLASDPLRDGAPRQVESPANEGSDTAAECGHEVTPSARVALLAVSQPALAEHASREDGPQKAATGLVSEDRTAAGAASSWPTSGGKSAKCGERASSDIERASSDTERASSDIERASSDTERASSDIERASSDIEQASSDIERAFSALLDDMETYSAAHDTSSDFDFSDGDESTADATMSIRRNGAALDRKQLVEDDEHRVAGTLARNKGTEPLARNKGTERLATLTEETSGVDTGDELRLSLGDATDRNVMASSTDDSGIGISVNDLEYVDALCLDTCKTETELPSASLPEDDGQSAQGADLTDSGTTSLPPLPSTPPPASPRGEEADDMMSSAYVVLKPCPDLPDTGQQKTSSATLQQDTDGTVTYRKVSQGEHHNRIVTIRSRVQRTPSNASEQTRHTVVETSYRAPGGAVVKERDVTQSKKKLTHRGSNYYERSKQFTRRVRDQGGSDFVEHEMRVTSDNTSVSQGRSWTDKMAARVEVDKPSGPLPDSLHDLDAAPSLDSPTALHLPALGETEASDKSASEKLQRVSSGYSSVSGLEDEEGGVSDTRGSGTVTSEAPRFVTSLAVQTLLHAGDALLLECDVTGWPEPSVSWQRDGRHLPDTLSFSESYDGRLATLGVDAVGVGDSGVYECVAHNEAGRAATQCAVTVRARNEPPHFTSHLHDVSVDVGKTVTLRCEVTGSPVPAVAWRRNGLLVGDTPDFVQSFTGGLARLDISTACHKLGGKYECLAQNEAGTARTSCHVTVNMPTSPEQEAPLPRVSVRRSFQKLSEPQPVDIISAVLRLAGNTTVLPPRSVSVQETPHPPLAVCREGGQAPAGDSSPGGKRPIQRGAAELGVNGTLGGAAARSYTVQWTDGRGSVTLDSDARFTDIGEIGEKRPANLTSPLSQTPPPPDDEAPLSLIKLTLSPREPPRGEATCSRKISEPVSLGQSSRQHGDSPRTLVSQLRAQFSGTDNSASRGGAGGIRRWHSMPIKQEKPEIHKRGPSSLQPREQAQGTQGAIVNTMPSYDQIEDEEELHKLMNATDNFEERKKIRARLRDIREKQRVDMEARRLQREKETEDLVRKKFEKAEEEKKRKMEAYQSQKPTCERDSQYHATADKAVLDKKKQADEEKAKKLEAYSHIAEHKTSDGTTVRTTLTTSTVRTEDGSTTVTKKTETTVKQTSGFGGVQYGRPGAAPELNARTLKEQLSRASGPGTSGSIILKTESWSSKDGIVRKAQNAETWGAKPQGPRGAMAAFKQMDANSPARPNEDGNSAGGGGSSGKVMTRSPSAIKQMLLDWCKAMTREYENVEVTNFSTCWNDGMAFCALIHHFFPDAFDFSKLDPKNRRYNFELAFNTAEKMADIAPLLDVEDMVKMKNPDWKCVFTYVQSIYRHLRDHGQNKTKSEA